MTAYLLYQAVFSLSRGFFNFFKLFSTRAASFRSSLFSISNREAFVKNFFHFFQILSDSAASHRSSSISILRPTDFCQHFFLYFFLFSFHGFDRPIRVFYTRILPTINLTFAHSIISPSPVPSAARISCTNRSIRCSRFSAHHCVSYRMMDTRSSSVRPSAVFALGLTGSRSPFASI